MIIYFEIHTFYDPRSPGHTYSMIYYYYYRNVYS